MVKNGIINRVKTFLKRKSYGPGNDYWYQPFQVPTKAGVELDETTSLNFSAVWNAIQIISGTIGTLPLHLYKKTGDRREKANTRRIYSVLHSVANPEMTAMNYREVSAAHAVSWGNWYSEIVRSTVGDVEELWPIAPNRVKPMRKNGQMIYEIAIGNGQKVILPREKVLHIPGLGFDGIMGYSVLTKARESIALGLATEEFGARYFGEGTHPGVVVSHPQVIAPEVHERLKKSLIAAHSGLGKSHRLMLLEDGMKMENISISPEDSQFLETRQFQVPEIARWFNIQPSKLKDHSRSTFNNIEHLAIDHVVDCIRPWLVRIEQNLNMQLLTDAERAAGLYFEHNVEGLLRGDSASRSEFYSKMFLIGAYSINEIREKENMNPVEGGDERFVPMNMVPLSMAKELAKPPEPEPVVVEPEAEGEEPEEEENEREWFGRYAEERANADLRDRVARMYHGIFLSMAKRIVSKETMAVKRASKKGGFDKWLDDFYKGHRKYIIEEAHPPFKALSRAVADAAEKETKSLRLDSEFTRFVDDYTDRFADRYIESSVGQIRALLKQKRSDETDDKTNDEIETRMDEWNEKRPDKIADNETTRLGNAMAQLMFWAAGMSCVWRIRGAKTCPYCRSLNGKRVARGQSFAGAGSLLKVEIDGKWMTMKIRGLKKHPPLHQGCMPGNLNVSATGIVASSERWFDGNLVVIETAAGNKLTCTPNHPVFTRHGWVAANKLVKGNEVRNAISGDIDSTIVGNDENVPPLMENVAKSFIDLAHMIAVPVPATPEDFHGDAANSEVAIIRTDGRLLSKFNPGLFQKLREFNLLLGNSGSGSLSTRGGFLEFVETHNPVKGCPVCGFDLPLSLILRHFVPDQLSGGAAGPGDKAEFDQFLSDRLSGNAEMFRHGQNGLPGRIAFSKIVSIDKVYSFHGFVFNLHTESNSFYCENVLVHNCDCYISAV